MLRREKLRQEMLENIKAAARRQMTETGAAGISFSAIARELEISQPALYRYYASRDDLITALTLDAFNELTDAVEQSDRQAPVDEHGERMLKAAQTYRGWALENPADFRLIFSSGSSVKMAALASRGVLPVILAILMDAYEAGVLAIQPEYRRAMEALPVFLSIFGSGRAADVPRFILYLGWISWSRIHGMVMLELFHQTQEIVYDSGHIFDYEVQLFLKGIGL